MARHFNCHYARIFQSAARCFGHAVVPSEIARIVEGDLHIFPFEIHGYLPGPDQFVDQLRVMDDFIIPTEGGVLILDRMQTVRAGCDDARRALSERSCT